MSVLKKLCYKVAVVVNGIESRLQSQGLAAGLRYQF